ncbi:MAG: DHH family phosphoesterase [Gammaproteobacteria bacterium]|nr:DHH family phosphoesterase [Gammaproteobacteria bacterium]
MTYIDCFNGDADGICALTQIRLKNPVESRLITGVKRDISLVDRATAASGDIVTVLDISLDKNRAGVERVIQQGAEVFYCDHHYAGEIPDHPRLKAIINTAPDVCTSLLINQFLKGRFLAWAVVGTFGDNLYRSAAALAKPLQLTPAQLSKLQDLGTYLNYNGYGSSIEDLHFNPAELFKRVSQHATPQLFIENDPDTYATLEAGYLDDMRQAANVKPLIDHGHAAVFQMPDAAWARRVSGVYGNQLANQHPARAHAVITQGKDHHFVVSIRAPLENKRGADQVCRQFPGGGGRAAAAGINALPLAQLDEFIDVFTNFYRG